jgi:hypothetical protein
LTILALWGSVSEHLVRTKHDNPKAALAAAAMAGYAGAPVITCSFFDAGAVFVTANQWNMKNVRERFIAHLTSLGYMIRYRELFQRERRVGMKIGQSELLLFQR